MDSQLYEEQPFGKYEPKSVTKMSSNAINSHGTMLKLCDRGTDTETWILLKHKSSNRVNELYMGWRSESSIWSGRIVTFGTIDTNAQVQYLIIALKGYICGCNKYLGLKLTRDCMDRSYRFH